MEILRSERETSNEGNIEINRNSALEENNVKEIYSYPKHDGIGPFNDVNLPGVWFYKMPHKVCSLQILSKFCLFLMSYFSKVFSHFA